ncbi:MAG: response regulator [Flavobacteriales bacterium]|nr:response regulator [Flavobacteriales bacterium]
MDIYILENNVHDKVFLQAIFSSMIENDSVIFFDDVGSLLDCIKGVDTLDAVIFDISTDGTGLELIKDLHRISSADYCPVVIYTHHNHQTTIDAAFDLGVHSYIIKQLNPTSNIEAITRAIDAIRNSSLGRWG